MRKAVLGVFLAAFITMPLGGEEILLKDGTKIVGRMLAIRGDKIEVQTPYGKMQVGRGDIQSINFPENQSVAAGGGAHKEAMAVEESMEGTQYTNLTGRFTLTVPIEWKPLPEMRKETEAVAVLGSRDGTRWVAVVQEVFPGSLEGYKGIMEIQRKNGVENYEKMSESEIKVDGHQGVLSSYRSSGKLPVQFLSGIVDYGGKFVVITGWCLEPLFKESQRTFENIILSYKQMAAPGTAEPK